MSPRSRCADHGPSTTSTAGLPPSRQGPAAPRPTSACRSSLDTRPGSPQSARRRRTWPSFDRRARRAPGSRSAWPRQSRRSSATSAFAPASTSRRTSPRVPWRGRGRRGPKVGLHRHGQQAPPVWIGITPVPGWGRGVVDGILLTGSQKPWFAGESLLAACDRALARCLRRPLHSDAQDGGKSREVATVYAVRRDGREVLVELKVVGRLPRRRRGTRVSGTSTPKPIGILPAGSLEWEHGCCLGGRRATASATS